MNGVTGSRVEDSPNLGTGGFKGEETPFFSSQFPSARCGDVVFQDANRMGISNS